MNASAIASAVSYVLYEHECAVVPGFGAFILRKNYGVANPFSGQLKPASHSIYFNSDIREDDGFVANALKEQLGYTYKQAGQLLVDFALSVSENCQNSNSFKLDSLGSFYRNPAGELFFLAEPTLNLSLQTYGLPVFHWEWKVVHQSISNPIPSIPSTAPQPIAETKSTVAIEKEEEKVIETVSQEHTIPETEELHSNFTVSKRSQPRLWNIAASFAIISIGAGVLMTVAQIWSVSSGQDLASLMPQDTQLHNPKPKQVDAVAEINREVESEEEELVIKHNLDFGVGISGIDSFHHMLSTSKGGAFVSGGSYITLDLAKRECFLWQKLGVDACVVAVKKSSLNKVVLGRFEDEQKASKFAESIKIMPTGTLSVTEVALDWKTYGSLSN